MESGNMEGTITAYILSYSTHIKFIKDAGFILACLESYYVYNSDKNI
jgi:hypothetical protein